MIFIIIVTYGCERKLSPLTPVGFSYSKSRAFFDEKYIDHFPKLLPYWNSASWREVTDSNSWRLTSFSLTIYDYELDEEEFLQLTGKAVASYNAQDEKLLILDYLRSEKKGFDKIFYDSAALAKKYGHLELDGSYPIPNFYNSEFVSNSDLTRLSDDFTVYILDAKKGIFWPSHQNRLGKFVTDWENGYSKGVAISKKDDVIIYWFVIW